MPLTSRNRPVRRLALADHRRPHHGEGVGLVSPRIDGDDVYWIENRPAEAGRSVVVRRAADGTITDAIPAAFNARTRVHEYGGGAYTVRDGCSFLELRRHPALPPGDG